MFRPPPSLPCWAPPVWPLVWHFRARSLTAAGVLLVTFRPFRAGEYVDLGGTAGTVLNVQIFSTTLRSIDGKIVIVPNKKVIDGNITNFSREPVRRNELIISVAYDSDIDQVKSLISNIIASDDRILKDKEQTIRLNELGASSINFVVRIWSKSSDLQNVYWDVLERIKREFDANGISFPYPQMDVNVKKSKKQSNVTPGPVSVSATGLYFISPANPQLILSISSNVIRAV